MRRPDIASAGNRLPGRVGPLSVGALDILKQRNRPGERRGRWKVVVDGTPILGGIDEKHRNPPDAETKATLYVKATSILGGIEIQD